MPPLAFGKAMAAFQARKAPAGQLNFLMSAAHRDMAMSTPLFVLPDSKAVNISSSKASMGAMKITSRFSFALASD